MARRVGRSRFGQETIGFLLAKYVQLVHRTSWITTIPEDIDALVAGQSSLICAMWHGQHLMMTLAWPTRSIGRRADFAPRGRRRAGRGPAAPRDHAGQGLGRACRSRILQGRLSRDARAPASARVGRVRRVDGRRAQARPRRRTWHRHARQALGRPIAPTAVVTSRRLQFDTWDRASLGLPFSRAVVVVGDLIRVQPDADDAALERARLQVQEGLDEAHRRAYAMVGATDPGANLRMA